MLLNTENIVRQLLWLPSPPPQFPSPQTRPFSAAMAMPQEYSEVMAAVGARADELWAAHRELIAGKEAYQAVQLSSVQSSHPAFPIFAYLLGVIPMLSNGASVNLWGSPGPGVGECQLLPDAQEPARRARRGLRSVR